MAQRGRPAADTRQLHDVVYDRFNGCCLGCGGLMFRADGWEIHHVVPRSEGGSDDLDNLAALCLGCHTRAEDMRPMPQTLWALKRDLRYSAAAVEKVWSAQKFAGSPETPWSCEEMAIDLDWHKWVYGGQANPFKNSSFIKHRVGCERCSAA